MLMRRISAGSLPSFAATRFTVRSRTKQASYMPGPRYDPCGVLLVSTQFNSISKAGKWYGPGMLETVCVGATSPLGRM